MKNYTNCAFLKEKISPKELCNLIKLGTFTKTEEDSKIIMTPSRNGVIKENLRDVFVCIDNIEFSLTNEEYSEHIITIIQPLEKDSYLTHEEIELLLATPVTQMMTDFVIKTNDIGDAIEETVETDGRVQTTLVKKYVPTKR